MNNKLIINGNEAVAYAAVDAHIRFFSHYPGSPVNRVEPAIKKLIKEEKLDIAINDSHNEHIAALSAMGASFANTRSMVVMKHVGVNIAADPLVYAGYSGVKGGMVIIVGTDPGANSSTGEQDVHWYVKMFNYPLYEPISVQGIYDDVLKAYEISEEYELPVFVFIPVEMAHTIASLDRKNVALENKEIGFVKDKKRYINVGQKAINNHQLLVDKMDDLAKVSFDGKTYFNKAAKLGIITRGLGFSYVLESIMKLGLQDRVELLFLDRVFPVPSAGILAFAKNKEELLFVEDQDGFLENMVKQICFNELDCTIHGKDVFPVYGALDSTFVYQYLASKMGVEITEDKSFFFDIEERLGTFCEGCPHTASYYAIFKVLEGRDYVLGGDIGCSSLPPFKADWLLCMNAGIGISQGIAQVSKDQLVVSTGGDGSFFHGGMISLQSAVENKVNLIHIVFDNSYVAMTGHQYSPSGGSRFDVEKFLESIGVRHFSVVDVYKRDAMQNAILEAIDHQGVRVIWANGACSLITESLRGKVPHEYKMHIENDKCLTCNACYEELACPAIFREESSDLLVIDEHLCVRCGTCHSICPNEAISHVGLNG